MTTVKELFAKHGVEGAELMAEIQSLLTIAESKKSDSIPYSRFKEKVDEVNQLKADKAELESQLTSDKTEFESKFGKLETKFNTQKTEITDLKGIKGKYESYVETENKLHLDKWNINKKIFAIEKEDTKYPAIQKIITKFNLNEELTAEQVKANNSLFDTYNEIGYFGEPDPNLDDAEKAKGGRGEKPVGFKEKYFGKLPAGKT